MTVLEFSVASQSRVRWNHALSAAKKVPGADASYWRLRQFSSSPPRRGVRVVSLLHTHLAAYAHGRSRVHRWRTRL